MKPVTYLPRYRDSNNHHPLTIALQRSTLLCVVVSEVAVFLCEIVESKV